MSRSTIVDACETHHFSNAVSLYHPMARLMNFSAHNGSRSASSHRQQQSTHPANQFFSSSMGTVRTSRRKSTSSPSHTKSIFSASLPTQLIGYNLSTLVSLGLLQLQWHVNVIKFFRTLGPKFLYKTLSRSTCWLVMKLSRLKPLRRLLKTAGSGHSIPTSSPRQTMHQVEFHQSRPTPPRLIPRQYLKISHTPRFLAMTMTSLTRIPATGTFQMVKASVMAMVVAMVKAMMAKMGWMKTMWMRTIKSSITQMTNHHMPAAQTITNKCLSLHYLHLSNYLISRLGTFTGSETQNASSWILNSLSPFSFPKLLQRYKCLPNECKMLRIDSMR